MRGRRQRHGDHAGEQGEGTARSERREPPPAAGPAPPRCRASAGGAPCRRRLQRASTVRRTAVPSQMVAVAASSRPSSRPIREESSGLCDHCSRSASEPPTVSASRISYAPTSRAIAAPAAAYARTTPSRLACQRCRRHAARATPAKRTAVVARKVDRSPSSRTSAGDRSRLGKRIDAYAGSGEEPGPDRPRGWRRSRAGSRRRPARPRPGSRAAGWPRHRVRRGPGRVREARPAPAAGRRERGPGRAPTGATPNGPGPGPRPPPRRRATARRWEPGA